VNIEPQVSFAPQFCELCLDVCFCFAIHKDTCPLAIDGAQVERALYGTVP
jgi:hypothetical protein